MIEGSAALVMGDVKTLNSRRQLEAVKVLGVDILRDQPFREYNLLQIDPGKLTSAPPSAAAPEVNAQTLLQILTSPQTVIITEKLATGRHYALGGPMRLMIGDRVLDFVVRGILKNDGPARVLDGNFILMDIAAAQLAFDRLGRVDRLDVLLPDGADPRAAVDAIGTRLPPGLVAQRPGRRGEQVETMLAAFHTNLTALSWIALIVGLFLVYNTVTTSVIA